ncbi:MAG: DNA invertase Pin [Euryarchaeota archaeon]|nr:DNA invertase Pin [Euryarchaeota archaeon]
MTVVYGYIRASTIEEVKQGSNERQRELIEKFCREKGYELKIYEDQAKSGASTDRPAFQKMMSEIDGADIVVITKIDRMARSLIDLLNTIQILEKKGIGFISLLDPGIDTTSPNGKLLLQILGAFAEFERNLINQRTQAGKEKARQRGVKFGRPRGKLKNGKFIDEKLVMELKQKGLSARAIAKVMGCSPTPILRILKEKK